MQNRIIRLIGIQFYEKIIVIDSDRLWKRFYCDDAPAAVSCRIVHISDEMELRRFYEWNVSGRREEKYILVIDREDLYIPADIRKCFYVQNLTYRLVFPLLDTAAVRELPGLDYTKLLFLAEHVNAPMNYEETIKFCTETLPEDSGYPQMQLYEAERLAKTAGSHRDWNAVAQLYGQAAKYHHTVQRLADFDACRMSVETGFGEWIRENDRWLSGSVDRQRPVLLSKTADYIYKKPLKTALIVMDGMSFENFYVIRDHFVREPFALQISSSFSFLPTVTSVARQSIFSGRLPRENAKPFSLEYEEKQWRDYWKLKGIKDNDIGFYKTDSPEYDPHMKAVGIVINICDDLMHAELQGMKGLNQGIVNWLHAGALKRLLERLIEDGFHIFMTSDHGNTSAVGQGRFHRPGLLAEPASRRAVIYQSFDDAPELRKFQTIKYQSRYLPDGYDVYLFDTDVCYGDKGKEYITHGGMTIEEVIVPFVKIGAYNG